jgi:hypothetical protein
LTLITDFDGIAGEPFGIGEDYLVAFFIKRRLTLAACNHSAKLNHVAQFINGHGENAIGNMREASS